MTSVLKVLLLWRNVYSRGALAALKMTGIGSMFLIFWTSKQPVAFFKGSNFGKSVETWPAKKKFPGLMDHKILGWNTACFASNNNLGFGKQKPNLSCLKKWLPPKFSVEQIEWFQFQLIKEIPGIRVDRTSPSPMEHPQVRWNIPKSMESILVHKMDPWNVCWVSYGTCRYPLVTWDGTLAVEPLQGAL